MGGDAGGETIPPLASLLDRKRLQSDERPGLKDL